MSISDDILKARKLQVNNKTAKILILDIETAPSLAYVWSLWKENIPLDRLIESGEVICFAAKWWGDPTVMFFSNHEHGHEDMIHAAWELMNEADVIVHFNGKKFDIPHLYREFLLAGLTPPSPHKDVDLYTVVRSRFRFISNKLDHVAKQLGLEGKIKHSGFQLWVRCMNNDPDAWIEMQYYNIQDVLQTEEVHDRVLPWIKPYPTVVSTEDEIELRCTKCGSAELEKVGVVTTATFLYDRYVCNQCGAWFKGNKATRITNITAI